VKIKKSDTVLIISGKDRARTGRILKVFPKEGKILVEGINLHKKHIRPKKEGEKGQIIQVPSPLDISDVKLICSKCKKVTRVGYKMIKFESGRKAKVRICKKCGQEI